MIRNKMSKSYRRTRRRSYLRGEIKKLLARLEHESTITWKGKSCQTTDVIEFYRKQLRKIGQGVKPIP